MYSKKEKLKNFLCNFVLFADKNTDNVTLYYNKSFKTTSAILNHTDVNNFIQNYLDDFDDNLKIIYISGKNNNVYDFLYIVDYFMVTENGSVLK